MIDPDFTIIDALERDLRVDEGERPYVYDDATGKPITKGTTVVGYPTIGVGRVINNMNGVSKDEISLMLTNDCTRVLQWCISSLAWFPKLSDVRKRAVANMVFQLGIRNFLGFRFFLECMARHDYERAYDHGKDSDWYRKTPRRAEKCLERIKSGLE